MRRLQCGDNKFFLFHHLFLFQDFFVVLILYVYNHLTTYIYKMVCWLYLLVIQEDFVLSKYWICYYKQCMTDKQSIFLPASIIFVDIFIAYSG